MVFEYLKKRYQALKQALGRTRLGERLRQLLQGPLNSEALDKIEQLLYEADLGAELAAHLTSRVAGKQKQYPQWTSEQLVGFLKEELLSDLEKVKPLDKEGHPHVILIVGVNGNGKTTSVARLAARFQNEGKKVLVGAADTFRAAAIDQLALWSEQCGFELVKGNPKGDPAAVAYDTCAAGKARGADVVIIDTAGRLHAKTALMQELEKIERSCRKLDSQAPHEILLVLDATTGNNGIDQAVTFKKFTNLSGLILTKLDGTAKGGIAIAIQRKLHLPIRWIGIGEKAEDLQPFDAHAFINALFES